MQYQIPCYGFHTSGSRPQTRSPITEKNYAIRTLAVFLENCRGSLLKNWQYSYLEYQSLCYAESSLDSRLQPLSHRDLCFAQIRCRNELRTVSQDRPFEVANNSKSGTRNPEPELRMLMQLRDLLFIRRPWEESNTVANLCRAGTAALIPCYLLSAASQAQNHSLFWAFVKLPRSKFPAMFNGNPAGVRK